MRTFLLVAILSLSLGCSDTSSLIPSAPSAVPDAGQTARPSISAVSAFKTAYPSPADCEKVGVMNVTWPGRNWRATSPTLVNVTDSGYATWGIPAWVTGWDSTTESVTVQYYKWRLRHRGTGSRWDGWGGWTRENGRSVQVPMGEVGRYQFQVAACVKQTLPSTYGQSHWMVVTKAGSSRVRVF